MATKLSGVRLVTQQGGLVHEQTSVVFSLFTDKPDVIVWGERFFRRDDTIEADVNGVLWFLYREAFTWALVPEPA